MVQAPVMAGTGTFDIEIIGSGGHAAFPHKCVDPLYIGAGIVERLQGIVSRVLDPLIPAVVSVTQFHAGTAFNIIAERATLRGTFRALDAKVLEEIREHIIRIATDVATAHGATTEIRCELGYPVLSNNPRAQSLFMSVMEETGDLASVVETAPILGGEDFAFYSERVPAFFYFLPACPVDQSSNPVCHHPAFDFNDELLPTGIRLHVELARRFAKQWKA